MAERLIDKNLESRVEIPKDLLPFVGAFRLSSRFKTRHIIRSVDLDTNLISCREAVFDATKDAAYSIGIGLINIGYITIGYGTYVGINYLITN